jgi:hypothetical protein
MPQPSRRGPTQNQEARPKGQNGGGNPSGLGTYESYPPTEAHPPTPHTRPLSLSLGPYRAYRVTSRASIALRW